MLILVGRGGHALLSCRAITIRAFQAGHSCYRTILGSYTVTSLLAIALFALSLIIAAHFPCQLLSDESDVKPHLEVHGAFCLQPPTFPYLWIARNRTVFLSRGPHFRFFMVLRYHSY